MLDRLESLEGMMHNMDKKKLLNKLDYYRIYIIFAIVFILMSLFAPNFLNVFNIVNILKGMSLNAMVAVGFTVVMICGQLDLSIGSNLTLGAMVVIALQPILGWWPSLAVAMIAGSFVGAVNGFLVAKAKIHSFIVTLGTMTIVQGLIFLLSKGSALSVNDFTLADWLEMPKFGFLPPRVIITVSIVLMFFVLIKFTKFGKGFYLVGGNKETAWLAGLNTDLYLILAFILSGLTAALGGALLAMSISSAVPTLGTSSQMVVIAAVIIGGTSMAGGTGDIFRSMIAVIMLVTLFNGLMCCGAGYEVQIFASGLVLAAVVLGESYALYQQDKVKGQRPNLMAELKKGALQ
ncbi:MAG: permease component of ribose/xylose/arabinose/galactoside ABC-type transporter [Clostridia bacterium]|jgi:ribose transport system permease protein|nr:permease component of ribose/xylose/arabinose/galactoside ABC-type transporter [Clostridia bacterium]